MITVTHSIGDLADDLRRNVGIATSEPPKMAQRAVRRGEELAKGFAIAGAGPHGKLYYRRISSEMLTPLSGEYGPEGTPKSDFVGVGYRNGGPNMDLPNSADIVVLEMAEDAQRLFDRLFW